MSESTITTEGIRGISAPVIEKFGRYGLEGIALAMELISRGSYLPDARLAKRVNQIAVQLTNDDNFCQVCGPCRHNLEENFSLLQGEYINNRQAWENELNATIRPELSTFNPNLTTRALEHQSLN